MSHIKRRLARLNGSGGRQEDEAPKTISAKSSGGALDGVKLAQFRGRLRGLGRGKRNEDSSLIADIERVDLPGVEENFGQSKIQIVRETFHGKASHGDFMVDSLWRDYPKLGNFLNGADLGENIGPNVLFLDTETTGLAGGTGTIPFMIGLGYFQGGTFNTEQLILRQPGQEKPILRYVAEKIEAADALITFNGKSYDLPLIRSRCVLGRVKLREPGLHLDLLHGCRRIFGGITTDGRLTTLERDILGFIREDDIPGAEIPEAYFEFLRSGETKKIHQIAKHNLWDLLAMAALMNASGLYTHKPQSHDDARVWLAVAKLNRRLSWDTDAIERAKEVCACSDAANVALQGALLLAQMYRRQKLYRDAADCLEMILAKDDGAFDSAPLNEAHLVLAKIYEHQLKDLT